MFSCTASAVVLGMRTSKCVNEDRWQGLTAIEHGDGGYARGMHGSSWEPKGRAGMPRTGFMASCHVGGRFSSTNTDFWLFVLRIALYCTIWVSTVGEASWYGCGGFTQGMGAAGKGCAPHATEVYAKEVLAYV